MRPAFSSRTNKRPTAVLLPDASRNPETGSSVISVSFRSFPFIHFTIAVQSRDSTNTPRSFDPWDDHTRHTSLTRTPAFRRGGLLRPTSPPQFLISAATRARENAATSHA